MVDLGQSNNKVFICFIHYLFLVPVEAQYRRTVNARTGHLVLTEGLLVLDIIIRKTNQTSFHESRESFISHLSGSFDQIIHVTTTNMLLPLVPVDFLNDLNLHYIQESQIWLILLLKTVNYHKNKPSQMSSSGLCYCAVHVSFIDQWTRYSCGFTIYNHIVYICLMVHGSVHAGDSIIV